MDNRELIARRIAKELKDGDVVNLGIGMPTLVANYIPEGVQVILQSENGLLGLGPRATEENMDPNIVDAGGAHVTVLKGASFFDSATSFGIIRGGHVNDTVLGALEVDQEGNLASWMVPGKMVTGMGGAMDLVVGAKKVIIAMEHLNKKGAPKILKKCNLPLTAAKQVNMIVTEKAVFEVVKDKGLVLKEIAPGLEIEDIKNTTEADFIVSKNLKTIEI
ncbi:3-oxoacid CoA-transferase subunit B [Draconibacterium sp. IB214405]|uniref:3-oxoacid CoA-transferase subunit B n=1 Tax=Draconibacterium sp. IB214405 TaxID=3097352 RepID=UPI002A0FBDA9|nr:3-oxoacid CoA-transferase subunit B [Draconibacterium sp. IB214405]MDX8339777.1 3-oxoacid CoA-transferase subunit B [Draconibacterium sp. IB214405]